MKEIEVTREHDIKYLEYPDNCPICDSDNINGGHIEAGYTSAWRDVSCLNCGAKWTELFELTGIANLTIKEDDD